MGGGEKQTLDFLGKVGCEYPSVNWKASSVHHVETIYHYNTEFLHPLWIIACTDLTITSVTNHSVSYYCDILIAKDFLLVILIFSLKTKLMVMLEH